MELSFENCREQLASVLKFAKTNKYSKYYHNLPEHDNLSKDDFDSLPVQAATDFHNESPFTLLHYPKDEVLFTISTFKPSSNDFHVHPIRRDYAWSTIKNYCEQLRPNILGLIAPSLWQLGPLVYHATRSVQVPVVHTQAANPIIIERVLEETGLQFLCTTTTILKDLQTKLSDPSILDRIDQLLLIAPIDQTQFDVSVSGDVQIEFHLFPGVPVAVADHNADTGGFCNLNYSKDYYFEFDEKNKITTVTSLRNDALPLVRYQVNSSAI